MSNRLFQGIVHQMKDAIDRTIGVIDETSVVIACSELGKIGEVNESVNSETLSSTAPFVINGYTYKSFGSNAKYDYAVFVQGTDGKVLECTITRQRRPDVEEAKGISEEEKRNLGFSITVNLENTNDQNICICFRGKDVQKIYTVNVKKIKRENTGLYQQMKLLSLKNRQKNQEYIKKNGIGRFIRYVRNSQLKDGDQDYEDWLKDHVAFRKELKRQRNAVFSYSPLISIVIPLYCTPTPYLKELIDSVRAQSYTNWQLCLADGSPDQKVEEYIQKRYGKDSRILYKHLEENGGISINTNKAIEMATGEYLMLSDHDDTLEPDALYEIVKAINDHQGPEIVYTDEDKLSMDGEFYFEPHFKSDYNLFRLRDNNYICHIFAPDYFKFCHKQSLCSHPQIQNSHLSTRHSNHTPYFCI